MPSLSPTFAVTVWVVAGLILPLGAAAQAGGPDPPPDSAGQLRSARQAQARFERVREFRLPWTHGSSGRPCHERVGRYCVWHDRTDDEWIAPREHRDVSEARDVLLVHLREALALHPGDAWLIGQRVAYLLDAGRADDALDAARSCRANAWWCVALAGLVHHVRGETIDAERSFGQAMQQMPPDELATWQDLEPVLSASAARRIEALAPRARDSLAATLWWLADPLWMVPGNDRYAEQLSRRVRARLVANARTVEGMRWGRDMEELLLRFGWPAGWERYATGGLERRVGIVTHRVPFGREFVPPLDHISAPERIPVDAWSLTPRIPRTEHAPSYARFEGSLALQLAVFPDGDSAEVAAAFAFEHDSVARSDSVVAALIVATQSDAVMDSTSGVVGRAVRVVRVAHRDLVASVEAIAGSLTPRAARLRLGIPIVRRDSSAVVLSDPLLIDPEYTPASRPAAIQRMLLPRDVATADSIGVYFEASRLAPDVPVEIELSLEPERSGGVRRLGESIGLVSRRSAVRLAWREPPPANGQLTRALTIGLGEVPAGRYTLRLLVRQGSAWGTSHAEVGRASGR